MKKILLAFSLFAFFTPLSMEAQIVGGSGFVKTASNPNSIASLTTVDQRYSASFAWDTTAQVLYHYDRTLASGSRWVVMPTTAQTGQATTVLGSGDVTVTTSGSTATVTYTDADKNPTNEAQTLSSTAVASNATTVNLTSVSGVGGGNVTINGGTGITLTGTANNLTISNPFAASIVADNPAHAAVLTVAVGQTFIASGVNTMGVPAGTLVRRMF